MCESGGKESAINPKDSDGKPSYGLLQFRLATFLGFSKQYGLGYTEENFMQGEAQKHVTGRMILDEKLDLGTQFPLCVKVKIGYPPK